MQQNLYGDMYHSYGYSPYGPYPSGSPVPSAGHDVQSYATQHYQYPGQYYQQQAPTNAVHSVYGANSQSELPSAAAHQARAPVASTKANTGTASGITNATSSLPRKQTYQNVSVTNSGSYGRGPSQGGPSAGNFGHSGLRSPAQGMMCQSTLVGIRDQLLVPHLMVLIHLQRKVRVTVQQQTSWCVKKMLSIRQ